MSEITERVARAIRDADVGFRIELTRLVDGVSTFELTIGGEVREFPGHDEAYEYVGEKRDAARARAAIEAMREPTEAMLHGARDWSIAKLGKAVGNRDATGCWRSMIEGALK